MDAIQAILTRRSMRHFTPEPVTPVQVDTLLRAAMHAPSACNQQPWHFIVVNQRETLDQIVAVHPYARMLTEAPLAVIVCGDLTRETCPGHWMVDCAAASQNLLLAAHALGLAGVWCAVHPDEKRISAIRELFHLPNFVIPLNVIAIGYAAEPLPVIDRYQPARVHDNGW
jgi:nitroreductase